MADPVLIVSIVVALAAGLGAGWALGSRGGGRAAAAESERLRADADRLRGESERLRGESGGFEAGLDRIAADLERGEVPDSPGRRFEGLVRALERHWGPRNAQKEDALRQALGRIAAFLEESVRGPLLKVLDGDAELLREGVDRALGGIKDLEFFLREPLTPDETHDLVPLVQQVVRDFIADWEVAVRFAAPGAPVRAHIHRDTFLDAVYLLLHNAGHFSEWKTVDVQISNDADRVQVLIRDRGPGFSDEALERARDLFYTTKPAGLGLGIPFARRIIEGFGGQLELRNRAEEGGAEVLLTLPGA